MGKNVTIEATEAQKNATNEPYRGPRCRVRLPSPVLIITRCRIRASVSKPAAKVAWFKPPGARVTLSAGYSGNVMATKRVFIRLSGQQAEGWEPPKCYPGLNQAAKVANPCQVVPPAATALCHVGT